MRGDILNRLPEAGGLVSEQIAAIEAEARAGWRDAIAAHDAGYASGRADALREATALLDAVQEAVQSEALPGNVHHRLEVAYNAVVAEANR
jgi:hypothetical protein